MARPIWSGILSFGLVSVPVSLYAATENHTVAFRQIQRGTSDRVRNKRVNERTGEEVAFGDIVKGFELAEGEYVVVEPDELDRITPGRSKTIEITGFVDLEQVEPIYFDTTYYLGPKGKEYGKVYTLLQRALEKANRAGIAMFSMRGKEYLTAVRSENGILTAHTMHFADEVRDPHSEIPTLPAAGSDTAEVSDRELAMAEQLVDMLAVEWKPEDYRDTFEEKVHELIAAKQAGQEVTAPEAAPAPSNVLDLMDILGRSLESAKTAGSGSAAKADDAKAVAGAGAKSAAAKAKSRAAEAGSKAGAAADRASTGHRPKDTGGKKSTSTRARPATSATGKKTGTAAGRRKEDLSGLTKSELYKKATAAHLPHRSTMTRDQLQTALEKTGHGRHLHSAS
ncbi:Ku protein [Kitasatospora sp. NBC_00240]|uniref:non-homologous end joining protein Ku n=1 Tax=Kitasatospora sp. NBC_00240 TaxID=2903567 RepID=UPI00225A8022|nr:Ku protein [Kitasatospora sp. NBC_00240]MCX5216123.1 Ku protein [Kitasatospora sp. NBC_00240]